MADKIVHNHTPKTEDHGLFDCFGKKDENEKKEDMNEGLLAKLHITDNGSNSSDGEKNKKKEPTLKEKVEKKIEEDKVKINVMIEEGREKALDLKEKTVEKIEEGKDKVGEIKEKIGVKIRDYNEKKEAKKNDENKVKITMKIEDEKDLKDKAVEKLEEGKEKVVEIKEKIGERIEDYKEKQEAKKNEEQKAKYKSVGSPTIKVVVHPPEPSSEPEEKKGFMDMIKDKLPNGNKKTEVECADPPPPQLVAVANANEYVDGETEHKEKKGILEMIKEKLPGYHSKSEEEMMKKEKDCDDRA